MWTTPVSWCWLPEDIEQINGLPRNEPMLNKTSSTFTFPFAFAFQSAPKVKGPRAPAPSPLQQALAPWRHLQLWHRINLIDTWALERWQNSGRCDGGGRRWCAEGVCAITVRDRRLREGGRRLSNVIAVRVATAFLRCWSRRAEGGGGVSPLQLGDRAEDGEPLRGIDVGGHGPVETLRFLYRL